MADYMVCGMKGAGKTLHLVRRMQSALLKGRQVATNVNLNVEYLLPLRTKVAIIYRVPDVVTGEVLFALGKGGDRPDERYFGELVVDEGAVLLNARDWGNTSRKSLLQFIPQSRKTRWNTYFITQLQSSMDKQIRGLGEMVVNCFRTDRVPVPFVGGLITSIAKLFGGRVGTLPLWHVGFVYFQGNKVDTWLTSGSDLYQAYDTEQLFSDSYGHGLYCVLPPWYLVDWKGALKGLESDWFDFEWVGSDGKSGRPSEWSKTFPIMVNSSSGWLYSILSVWLCRNSNLLYA